MTVRTGLGDSALWLGAGALVVALHAGGALWLAHQARAATPGLPEAIFIDMAPAETATDSVEEEAAAEPEPAEPEVEQAEEPPPMELPELSQLEPMEDVADLFPDAPVIPDLPELQTLTPPEIKSEVALNSSVRPDRRPVRREPEPEPQREPRREPEQRRRSEAQPQQPSQQRQQQSAQQGGGGVAPGPSRQELANLEQQWGAKIGACIQRRAGSPRGVRGGGTVAVSVRAAPNGGVQVTGVAGSSGNPQLDQAVVQAAQRARRCPAAPRGLTNASYSFTLPIRVN